LARVYFKRLPNLLSVIGAATAAGGGAVFGAAARGGAGVGGGAVAGVGKF
jgi:hypothetical protein